MVVSAIEPGPKPAKTPPQQCEGKQIRADVALQAANAVGIPVFNAPFSNTRSVAELVICEVIALARQLGDRSGELHRWPPVNPKC